MAMKVLSGRIARNVKKADRLRGFTGRRRAYLAVTEDGDCRLLPISNAVAEVLIANGMVTVGLRTHNIKHIQGADHLQVYLPPRTTQRAYLDVSEDGNCRLLPISNAVAEVLIANGMVGMDWRPFQPFQGNLQNEAKYRKKQQDSR